MFYAMLLPLGGLTILGAGYTSRRRRLLGLLLVCLLVSGLIFLAACGGGSGGGGGGGGGTPRTTAGAYTVTVTGTTGGVIGTANKVFPIDTDGDDLPDAYEENGTLNADVTGANVLISLLMYVAVYLVIYPVGVSLMLRFVWRGPVRSDEAALIGGGRPKAPIEALASPTSGTAS